MSRLGDRLRARIEQAGPITFAEFMEAALYDPDDGFYVQAPRIGRGGAFATAPTVLPLFAEALADELRDAVGSARPSGAVHGLRGRSRGRRAWRPRLAGRSPTSRSTSCSASAPRDSSRVSGNACRRRATLRSPTSRPSPGAIIANEVHDACPAHALRWPDELRVGVDGAGALRLGRRRGCAGDVATDRRAFGRLLPRPGLELAVSPAQAELQGLLAGRVARGALFVFDYGEDGPERYLRPVPHLRTYLAGRPGGDPLAGPGAQDITVDVDFGDVRAAGERAGLRTVLDEPQPAWLRRHGALERAEALPLGSEERLWLESFARDEASGASFRVLVQERV